MKKVLASLLVLAMMLAMVPLGIWSTSVVAAQSAITEDGLR